MQGELNEEKARAGVRGPPGSGKTLVGTVSQRYRRGTVRATQGRSYLRYFGFTDNPFTTEYVLGHPELVPDTTKRTLYNLAERSGFASESKSNMLLVGPEGAGKSLLLHMLANTLDQSMGSGFARYVDAPQVWTNGAAGDNPMGFRGWAKSIDFATTRLLLVDNIDQLVNALPQYVALLGKFAKKPPVMVLSVNLPTYSYMMSLESIAKPFPISMLVPQQEPKEVAAWLKASIRYCTVASDLFDDAAYESIAEYSLGLPGLAASLAADSLRAASDIGVTRLRKPLIVKLADMLLYGQGVKIAEGATRLEGTKADIVSEALHELYLRGEVRRGWLVEAFAPNLARSTLSYHLRDLVEERILIPSRFGFRMRYLVARPVRSAIQILQSKKVRTEDTISIGSVPRVEAGVQAGDG